MRIQTQARARAARAQRERHRQRHVARVGSIRSSGRAAADDLRALSRPGTAVVTAAAGEQGEDNVSAWDGAAEALLPITMGMMSMGSMESGSGAVVGGPQSGGSGLFSLPPALGMASVRTPSSVGSPTTVTAAATAAVAAGRDSDAQAKSDCGSGGFSGGGRGDVGNRSPGKVRSSYAASPPGSSNSSNGSRSRAASSVGLSHGGRSRSPSSARYESTSQSAVHGKKGSHNLFGSPCPVCQSSQTGIRRTRFMTTPKGSS